MVTFREKNLLDNLALMGKFDIILCRNVLIYFDEETKNNTLINLHKLMNRDSFLYLGSTESAFSVADKFEIVPDCRGLYRNI